MDVLLIFAAMIMIYIYVMVLYFYRKSKESQKKKSDLMLRAITYFRRENFDQANYYFELAYNESVESEDINIAAESLYYLAIIHNKNGDDPRALEFLKESLDYYQYLDEAEDAQKVQELISKISA
jgi:hypothetical protein